MKKILKFKNGIIFKTVGNIEIELDGLIPQEIFDAEKLTNKEFEKIKATKDIKNLPKL